MKHQIYIGLMAVCFLSFSAKAQVAIGKETVGNNALLDFDDTDNIRGIILPAVTVLPDNPANGTFVFDTTDSKVKVFVGIESGQATEGEDGWMLLTPAAGGVSPATNPADEIGGGVVIGAESSTADGVLVLESANKAMILPKIFSPHRNVKTPYPGMMCYDTGTKSLAVFDGSKWSFWK